MWSLFPEHLLNAAPHNREPCLMIASHSLHHYLGLGVFLLALILCSGCQTTSSQARWSPLSLQDLGVTAIVITGMPPTSYFPSGSKQYREGAAQGALTGILAMETVAANEGQDSRNSPCHSEHRSHQYAGCIVSASLAGVVTSLIETTAAASLGTLWGLAQTAAGHGPQSLNMVLAQEAVKDIVERPELQTTVAEAIQSNFISTFNFRLHLLQDSSYDTLFSPETRASLAYIHTFIFSKIVGVAFELTHTDQPERVRIVVQYNVKTFRGGSTIPSDVREYVWWGKEYPLEVWSENQAEKVRAQLYFAYQDLGHQVFNQLTSTFLPAQSPRDKESLSTPKTIP